MRKALLILVILGLLIPSTEVFAKNVTRCSAADSVEASPFATGTVNGLTVDCSDEAVCFKIDSAGQAGCYKASVGGTATITVNSTEDICKTKPEECTKGGGKKCTSGTSGIDTAIGCIPTEPKALIEGLLKFGTAAGGGIAFLLMLLASLEMITAEGSPEVIKKAQEKFYSAIIGLLLIIFAVLLMQIIGVDVLGLPGFGKQ